MFVTGQGLDKGAPLSISYTTRCVQCQYLKSAVFTLYLARRLDGVEEVMLLAGKEDVLLS